MTSLRAASGGRPIDRAKVLNAFTARLESRIGALFGGHFDGAEWADRQVTTGRRVDIVWPDGSVEAVIARGVDPVGGGLRLAAPTTGDPDTERMVVVGEIRHVRLAGV